MRRGSVVSLIGVVLVAAIAAATALTMVRPAPGGTNDSVARATRPRLIVFAAASLNRAFPAMVAPFKATHPEYRSMEFAFNFQGTDVLVQQIELGAPADVFAGASAMYGTQLFEDGLVCAPDPFCQNELCLIVPESNPAGIAGLGDLTKAGVKIAIGDVAVPIGAYTRTVLANITGSGDHSPGYYDQVMAGVAATCATVSMVVSLVQLGEVDAGFVYRSDPVYASVGKITIPNVYQTDPLPTYPLARVKAAEQPAAAGDFIDFVLSARGQRILKAYGFLPKPAPLVSAALPVTGPPAGGRPARWPAP